MKEGDRRYLISIRNENTRRLRNLGLPSDLFKDGFWEREAEAKKRELMLLTAFEGTWKSGQWDGLALPFADIIQRWKAEMASPLHFASIGPSPRWALMLGDVAIAWKRRTDGRFAASVLTYRRKCIAAKREAQGKPPSKLKT